MYNIDFYTFNNGESPIKDFLDSLEKKMLAKAIGTGASYFFCP